MNRFLTLGAAAALVAGCGQIRLPGWQSAGTTEPTQAAPPPTVVYEIHQAAPRPAVIASTTYVEIESPPAETVFVEEETPTYVYLHESRPPVRFIRRPRYAPPHRPPPPPRPPRTSPPRPPRPPDPPKPPKPPKPPDPVKPVPPPPGWPKRPGPPERNVRPVPPDSENRPRPASPPGPSDRPRDSEVGVVTELLQVWKHVARDIASVPEPSSAAPPARPQRQAVSEESPGNEAAHQDEAKGE